MKMISNKALLATIFVSLALLISISLSSAYSYSNQNSNQNTMFRSTSENAVFPSYSYSPNTYANSYNYNNIGSSYNLKYQGPLSERTTNYQVYYTQSKKGAIVYTVSATTHEKYAGEVVSLTQASHDKSDWGSESSSTSNNPTTYNGGSFWRYEPYYASSTSNSDYSSANRYW